MVDISNIITVNISSQTAAIQLPGFGIPNIIGVTSSTIAKGSSNSFTSMTGVGAVFSSSAPEWIAANAIFAQSPAPQSILISRELDRVAQISTLVFSANIITGDTVTGFINNTTISVPFNTSNTQTLTDLATALTIAGVSSAVSDAVHTITVTSAIAGISFILSSWLTTGGGSPPTIVVTTTTPNVGIAETISSVANLTPNFYGIIWTERTKADVLYAASVIEGLPYLFITANNDAQDYNTASTTDLMYQLKAASYTRTACLYSASFNTQFPDAAWMGSKFPTAPGSENWANQQLNGVTVDNLTISQVNAIINSIGGKNGNCYIPVANFDITKNGTCASGLYIDIRRGIDWLVSSIQAALFDTIVNPPQGKIPYTDQGVALLAGKLKQVLENGVKNNFIQPGYTVDTVPVSQIPSANIAARNYPSLSFTAVYVGAINTATVHGNITAFG